MLANTMALKVRVAPSTIAPRPRACRRAHPYALLRRDASLATPHETPPSLGGQPAVRDSRCVFFALARSLTASLASLVPGIATFRSPPATDTKPKLFVLFVTACFVSSLRRRDVDVEGVLRRHAEDGQVLHEARRRALRVGEHPGVQLAGVAVVQQRRHRRRRVCRRHLHDQRAPRVQVHRGPLQRARHRGGGPEAAGQDPRHPRRSQAGGDCRVRRRLRQIRQRRRQLGTAKVYG